MNAPNLKFIAHIVTLEICTRALVTARTTDCFKEYAILENSPDVRTTRHLLDYSSCQSFSATALPVLTAGKGLTRTIVQEVTGCTDIW